MTFEIGDRVRPISDRDGQDFSDETGIVAALDFDSMLPIGVRFDNLNPVRHSLGGNCEDGFGWWYSEEDLCSIRVDTIGVDELI